MPASTDGRTPAPADARPRWLLDVDGVINAVASEPDVSLWPARAWLRTAARAGGRTYPILAARPVLDFVGDVVASGAAEVRWHTTWQHDAVAHLAPALGLPALQVEDAPEFHAVGELPSGYAGGGHSEPTWWKLPAARRAIAAGRVLVWTDDDLASPTVQRALAEEPIPADTTLLVAPRTDRDLTPRHLRTIAAFLGRWQ